MPELYKPKNIENGHTIPENDLVNCGGDLKKASQNACVRLSQSEQNRDCQTQMRCIMIDNSSDGHVKQINNYKIVMREAQSYLCKVRNPIGFIDTYLTPTESDAGYCKRQRKHC